MLQTEDNEAAVGHDGAGSESPVGSHGSTLLPVAVSDVQGVTILQKKTIAIGVRDWTAFQQSIILSKLLRDVKHKILTKMNIFKRLMHNYKL